MTIWSFTDKYSWIPETFSGQGDALLYDKDFNKKAAWTSVSSVLAAKATGVVSSTTTAASTSTTLVTVTKTSTTSTSTSTSTTSTSTTSTKTTSTSTTSTKTTSTAASTTSSSGGAEQTRWGQCGGLYYSGPTKCQSPWTCQYQNDWYSQCL